MRIIAGEHRGRRIAAPEGQGTRPMLDRVREALFSTLATRVEGARVLDLFAGSGSLGLEALSRGATHATFVERHPATLDVLRANIELLGLGERSRVVRASALDPRSWVPQGKRAEREDPDPRYDLVFFDSPYPELEEARRRAEILETLDLLLTTRVAPGGLLVFHIPPRAMARVRLKHNWQREERTYGNSALLYLHPIELAEPTHEEAIGGTGDDA